MKWTDWLTKLAPALALAGMTLALTWGWDLFAGPADEVSRVFTRARTSATS